MQLLLGVILTSEIEMHPADRLLLVGALAVLGAVLGSFMNVVVYRMPRKLNLSYPGSRCPKCEHPIRWHDNVPVVGWLMLGGRCRDCGNPISARYPLVEALMATIGGLLAVRAPTLVTAAPTATDDGLIAVDLAWITFNLLLACTLVCAALIEFDGFAPPKRLIRIPLVVGLAMLAAWPHLQSDASLMPQGGTPIDGLVAAVIGMLTALALGVGPWFSWLINTQQSRFAYATGALGELVLVGCFLGAGGVISVALESMVLCVATQLLAQKWPAVGRFGWAGPLTLVTLVWVLARPDVGWLDLDLSADVRIRLIVAVSLMTVLAIVLQFVPARRQPV